MYSNSEQEFSKLVVDNHSVYLPGTKESLANLLEGFGVSIFFVPQLSIMHIVDFNEI